MKNHAKSHGAHRRQQTVTVRTVDNEKFENHKYKNKEIYKQWYGLIQDNKLSNCHTNMTTDGYGALCD